jgi:dTDP-4-amino-4,6-dideoxygalactose transaminase
LAGKEKRYLDDVLERREFAGNGFYTQRCQAWLQERLGSPLALLTHSCTAALEMAAILGEIGPGDEVILPSYTFVSTANAIALRGAVPVFVDIRPDTLNIDENKVEDAITERSRAIFVVHYAGVCAEMDRITEIARRHGLLVVEDAAQALLSSYHGRPAGTLGDLACFSFHATKNVIAGQGGALIVNSPALMDRAITIWEKGTNRRQFLAGQVDKYTWMDVGSSFLPNELTAAFLLAQCEISDRLIAARHSAWDLYHAAFAPLEREQRLRRPRVPDHCRDNAHIYYLLMPDRRSRDGLIDSLAADGIEAPFHYVPLHSTPAGMKYGRTPAPLPVTDDISGRLLRLPLYADIGDLARLVAERVIAHCGH